MKGQSSFPLSNIETLFTLILILVILTKANQRMGGFVVEQRVDLKVDQIENTALAMNSYDSASREFKFPDHKFRVDGRNIYLKYQEKVSNSTIPPDKTRYSSVSGPSEFKKIDKLLCVKKRSDELVLEKGGCGS